MTSTPQLPSASSHLLEEASILAKELQTLASTREGVQTPLLPFEESEVMAVERFYLAALRVTKRFPPAYLEHRMAAYIGELIRHHFGGSWVLCDVKKDPSYGTPVLIGWGSDPNVVAISGFDLCQKVKREQSGVCLKTVIEDLRFLEDEWKKIR